MIRVLFAFFLSLILAFTSHSTAVANGAPMAVDQMVICTGFGATVIYTDADGMPTAAPHLCPDCVMHLDAGVLPAFGMLPSALAVALRRAVPTGDAAMRSKPLPTQPVRGPPVVI